MPFISTLPAIFFIRLAKSSTSPPVSLNAVANSSKLTLTTLGNSPIDSDIPPTADSTTFFASNKPFAIFVLASDSDKFANSKSSSASLCAPLLVVSRTGSNFSAASVKASIAVVDFNRLGSNIPATDAPIPAIAPSKGAPKTKPKSADC